MNPFDFQGPPFLLFFICLAALLLLIRGRWLKYAEQDDTAMPLQLSTEPALMAYLRGGPNEALRLTTVTLIDRGLLQEANGQLQAHPGNDFGLSGLERQVWALFKTPAKAHDIFRRQTTLSQLQSLKTTLQEHRLWHGTQSRVRRIGTLALVEAILLTTGIVKIHLAMVRGHTNTQFLFTLLLASVVLFVLSLIGNLVRGQTERGKALIKQLQALHKHQHLWLLGESDPKLTPELVMMVGMFGMTALPKAAFPWVKRLYPVISTHINGTSNGCGSRSGISGGSSSGGSNGCGGCGSGSSN